MDLSVEYAIFSREAKPESLKRFTLTNVASVQVDNPIGEFP